jgi:hypothetical protein
MQTMTAHPRKFPIKGIKAFLAIKIRQRRLN